MVAKIIPETRKCLACPNTFLVGGAGNGLRSKKFCSLQCSGTAGRKKSAKLSNPLTESQAAYLAGMIDADGHIAIYNRTGPNGGGSRLRVEIANTHRPMLEWVQVVTGVGTIITKAPPNERYKTQYTWVTSAEAGASLLQQVLPFMIVKRARAELAIEYQVGLKDPARRADVEWRERYRVNMLRLNKRGPVA